VPRKHATKLTGSWRGKGSTAGEYDRFRAIQLRAVVSAPQARSCAREIVLARDRNQNLYTKPMLITSISGLTS
jgi:hypothetical protein